MLQADPRRVPPGDRLREEEPDRGAVARGQGRVDHDADRPVQVGRGGELGGDDQGV